MKRAHESSRGDSSRSQSHAEKGVRKKTEKLRQCTAEVKKEIEDLEQKQRRAKKAARGDGDEQKTEFLRQAAAIRRRLDDNAAEVQNQHDATARDEPELHELRLKLQDLNDQSRERREILEAAKADRLHVLLDEVAHLEREQ